MLKLLKALKALKVFETISKKLQDSTTTLSDVRAIFDVTIEEYPSLAFYLKADAEMVHYPEFEAAIVKVLDEKVEPFSEEEAKSITCFLRFADSNRSHDCDGKPLSLVEKALNNKQRKVGGYSTLSYVSPTSNIVERHIKFLKLDYSDYDVLDLNGESITSNTLRNILFLKINCQYWDLDLVTKLVVN